MVADPVAVLDPRRTLRGKAVLAEIADVVYSFLSDQSRAVSGQVLLVNAGEISR